MDIEEKLQQLKNIHDKKLISDSEYEQKRQTILDRFAGSQVKVRQPKKQKSIPSDLITINKMSCVAPGRKTKEKRYYNRTGLCAKCWSILIATCQNCGSGRLVRYVDWDVLNEEWFYCNKCLMNSHYVVCEKCGTQNPIDKFGGYFTAIFRLPLTILHFPVIGYLFRKLGKGLLFLIGLILVLVVVESANKGLKPKKVSRTPKAQDVAKDVKNRTKVEDKTVNLRKKICGFPPDKFKKYIRKNQKKIRENKKYVQLSRELNLQIYINTKKNKQLVRQIKTLRESDIKEKEKRLKVRLLKKHGRDNVAKIKELKEKLRFLDEIFTAKK